MLQPIPTPVKKRNTPNVHGSCTHSVTTIKAPAAMRLPSTIGRRPQRSESGVRKTEPNVIPIIPAESNQPSTTEFNPQSLVTAEAVKDITSTSTPSMALMRKHKAMARHCKRPIEAASSCWRKPNSEVFEALIINLGLPLTPYFTSYFNHQAQLC